MCLYIFVIQWFLFKQEEWASLKGVEKTIWSMKALFICENTKYFLKHFAEIYEQDAKDWSKQLQDTPNSILLRAVGCHSSVIEHTIEDGGCT